jgi:hypothetical protein
MFHLLEGWKLPCVVGKTHGKQDICRAFFGRTAKCLFAVRFFFVMRPIKKRT